MNKFLDSMKQFWGKLTKLQKIIIFSVLGVLLLAIILSIFYSSSPTYVPILSRDLTEDEMQKISDSLDTHEIHHVNRNNRIYLDNKKDQIKAKNFLIMEDLISKDTDPWEIFDVKKWTTTDFENDVNLRRAIQKELTLHIEALDDIDKANVTVTIPNQDIMPFDTKESSKISVVLYPKPASDIQSNKHKIKGIENLIRSAVPGVVSDENIVILDKAGTQLNDDENYGDDIDNSKRLLKLKESTENSYLVKIQNSLGKIFGDRVQVVNVDVALDAGKWTTDSTEVKPIVLSKDNPNTPSNEAKILDKVEVSEQSSKDHYKGTGEVPSGPPGSESQTNIAYSDEQKNFGERDSESHTTNYQSNIIKKVEQGTPNIKNINIGIIIDGRYEFKFDDKGKPIILPGKRRQRDYTPVAEEQIKRIEDTVKASIPYNEDRGDQVKVSAFQFDRRKQFEEEDKAYFEEKMTIFVVLGIISLLIFVILVIVLIIYLNRQRERKEQERRQREESERLRREREEELRRIQEQSKPLELTGEERERMELQEGASLMAREKPEEVAQLIKTWLLEE